MPQTIDKEEMLELVRWLLETIEGDDSFEGSFAYEVAGRNRFEVRGAIRFGNSEGQGSIRILDQDVSDDEGPNSSADDKESEKQ